MLLPPSHPCASPTRPWPTPSNKPSTPTPSPKPPTLTTLSHSRRISGRISPLASLELQFQLGQRNLPERPESFASNVIAAAYVDASTLHSSASVSDLQTRLFASSPNAPSTKSLISLVLATASSTTCHSTMAWAWRYQLGRLEGPPH